MPPKCTNTKKGIKTVWSKTTRVEKKGFTVVLAAMENGSKLPVVIISKERGVLGERVGQSLHLPSNVQVGSSTHGWMTTVDYLHWLACVLGKEKEQQLVISSYKPHQSEESTKTVRQCFNLDVIIIPSGAHQQAIQRA